VIVDTQLAYTLAGTEEDFVAFARSLASLAGELSISVVQICFYEFLPRHALADFLSMHSDVILSPALANSASSDTDTGSPVGLVSAIRALYLSKPKILRRVLDPVMTGSASADLLPLPNVTDYLREDFVLLDSDLSVRFVSQGDLRKKGSLQDILSATDLPRVLSVIESMKADHSAELFQLTLAGDSPSSGSPLLRIHKLAVDDELVGFLCVFHFVNPNGTETDEKKSGTESLVTEREHEIASLLLSGMRNREIAELLNVAEITVKKHLGSIYRKLGVRNRVELIRLWDRSQG
jgi:DNA-binding CsgD family transcriptional regulator